MRNKSKLAFIAVLLCAAIFANAQSPFRPLPRHSKIEWSPFKHLLPPAAMAKKVSIEYGIPIKAASLFAPNEISAWRFSLPFAGYDVKTQQLSTGLAYGWNKLHWIDSSQKYYTDLSIFGAILVNGNTSPTPYNFTAIGLGVGLFNGLINFIPAYNLGNIVDANKVTIVKPTFTDRLTFKVSFGLTLK